VKLHGEGVVLVGENAKCIIISLYLKELKGLHVGVELGGRLVDECVPQRFHPDHPVLPFAELQRHPLPAAHDVQAAQRGGDVRRLLIVKPSAEVFSCVFLQI